MPEKTMLTGDHLVKLALLTMNPKVSHISFNKSGDSLFVQVHSTTPEIYQDVVELVRDIVRDCITHWNIEARQEKNLIKSWWCGEELQVSIYNFGPFEKEEVENVSEAI